MQWLMQDQVAKLNDQGIVELHQREIYGLFCK